PEFSSNDSKAGPAWQMPGRAESPAPADRKALIEIDELAQLSGKPPPDLIVPKEQCEPRQDGFVLPVPATVRHPFPACAYPSRQHRRGPAPELAEQRRRCPQNSSPTPGACHARPAVSHQAPSFRRQQKAIAWALIPRLRSEGLNGKLDKKSRSAAHFRLKPDFAAVFLHDYVMSQGQALSGTLADIFGGEKRVEDSCPDTLRDSCSRIAHGDFSERIFSASAHCNLAHF